MNKLISDLKKKNPDLKEAEILGILFILNSKESTTNSELIRMTGLPKQVLTEFKTSISALLKKPKDEQIVLNQEGQGTLSELELRPYRWSLLTPETQGIEKRLDQLRIKYDLEPKRDYDQFFATTRSSAGKAILLEYKGLIKGKNIALIGDDDLVSLAISLIRDDYTNIRIFDIDEDILNTIKRGAKDLDLPHITTFKHDIRKPLPSTEVNKYDVVLIDPPYTKAGAQLFLHRSIELLKKSRSFEGSYILFNFGVGFKNPELESKLQEVINNFGLVIEDKINKYTRYHGAETVGSASSIYVLRTTPFTSVENSIIPQDIYTFEKTDIEKFPYTDHYTIKAHKVPKQVVGSKTRMQKAIGDFCHRHKLKVVNSFSDKFKGGGYSFTYILATSNLLVHTWPERNAVHIDLLTCSPIHSKEELGHNLSKLFKTKHIEVRWIE